MPELQITRPFFDRPTLDVCRDLLGKRLIKLEAGQNRLSGWIIEVEAYIGETDLACHARSGRTARNAPMWGPPGYLYTYFNYGMHWLMNFVTEAQGFPAAALLRAMVADEGSDLMRARRGNVPAGRLLDGPAKICQAFALDGAWSGYDLCQEQASLYLAPGLEVPDCGVTLGPRVGLNKVPEPWKSIPWRFSIQATDIQVSLEEI